MTTLCGIIGFVKHSSDNPNCEIRTPNKHMSMLYAKRCINKGEILTANFFTFIKDEAVQKKTLKRWDVEEEKKEAV